MILKDSFKYKKDLDNPAVLGVLEGPCADIQIPTRNGRMYSEALWEKVFQSDLVKESLENGGIFGEAQHPADREETDTEKIAIAMKEAPIKKNGKLFGRFYILDTPCGRIVKTLCDFGYKWGISSRGSGDVTTDYNGNESVDPDTYDFKAFDAVLIPAVKAARLVPVNESLGNKTLKQVLNESLNNAGENERKVMTETLDSLKIDYKDSSESREEDVNQTKSEAVTDGSDLVKDLQEALKNNAALTKQVAELQEKLSVSYAKDIKQEATLTKLKNAVTQLSEDVKKNSAVKTQLASMRTQLEEKSQQFIEQQKLLEATNNKLKSVISNRRSLNENIDAKNTRINDLTATIKSLKENLESVKAESESEVSSLKEELSELKTDSQVKNSQYAKKLSAANALVEKYRKTAETAVNRYIESKATQLGVTAVEIKNRLDESYSFDDVDKVCDSLRSYKRNMNKLPFNIGSAPIDRITLKENKDTKRFENPDDVVDDSFLETLN